MAAKRMGLGVPGAMRQRQEERIFGVNGLQFNVIVQAPLAQAAFAQDGHIVADANSAYAICKTSEGHLTVANLFDCKCSAHSDGFALPPLGAARIYGAGVRLKYD
jgi:hypothetical protein